MRAERAYNAWNTFRNGGIRSYTPTLAAPKFKPGPIVAIKTLCATKGKDTITATWYRINGCWQLSSFPKALEFLRGTDDYLEAMPLLESHGWLAQWHDSSIQIPAPL